MGASGMIVVGDSIVGLKKDRGSSKIFVDLPICHHTNATKSPERNAARATGTTILAGIPIGWREYSKDRISSMFYSRGFDSPNCKVWGKERTNGRIRERIKERKKGRMKAFSLLIFYLPFSLVAFLPFILLLIVPMIFLLIHLVY
ncbi:MAG: hypothetical protein QF400_00805 [Candidatus Peribacteraceae bacterium]|jgi:hypothetical protein|nr:hypothetical protein [Candidatus Peribacteraceae bacterium]|tara:strand:+ start:3109 stop:3543 length:435 start_codon:yes stop_codon:yes gene_type:complete